MADKGLVQRLKWHAADRSNLFASLTGEAAREIKRLELERDETEKWAKNVEHERDWLHDVVLTDLDERLLATEQELATALRDRDNALDARGDLLASWERAEAALTALRAVRVWVDKDRRTAEEWGIVAQREAAEEMLALIDAALSGTAYQLGTGRGGFKVYGGEPGPPAGSQFDGDPPNKAEATSPRARENGSEGC